MMNCVNWVMSWSIELVQGIEAVSDVSRVNYDQSALHVDPFRCSGVGRSWGAESLMMIR